MYERQYYVTHTDQYGERHQLSGAWIADSPELAIKCLLRLIGEEDDGRWEAFPVRSEQDIIA